MRTIIVLILTLTIPASAYVAGCRQDRSAAAFPKSSEMDKLAKAPRHDAERAPVIPPAPIDKAILNLPEQPQRSTMARINAVDDQSRQIAGAQPPAGLFTLPENDTRLAQSAPVQHQSAPAAMTPIPSGREFWSTPAPTSGRAVNPIAVPSDVSAMAPAQPQPILPPPSIPQSAAPGFAPPPGTKLLPPEPVPGVFDATMTSFKTGGPPEYGTAARFPTIGSDAHGAPLPSSRQTPGHMTPRGREPVRSGPVRLDLGGLVDPQPLDAVSETRFGEPSFQPIPIVQSIPGAPAYEPLPEPISLEEYTRRMGHEQRIAAHSMPGAPLMAEPGPTATAVSPVSAESSRPAAVMPASLPVPGIGAEPMKKSAIPFLPIPDFKPAPAAVAPTPLDPPATSNPKLASLLDSNAIREALAPLPDLSSDASGSVSASSRDDAFLPPLSMPPPAGKPIAAPLSAPMPEALPSPELTAAKTVLLDPIPSPGEIKTTKDVSSRDLFRMDLRDQMPAMTVKIDEALPSEKSGAARTMPESGAADSKPTTRIAAVVAKNADDIPTAPQKVKLTPIRSRQRFEELGKIDAATEAPPIRF